MSRTSWLAGSRTSLKRRGIVALPTPEEVADAAVLACLLEVAAPKPGNVTRYQDLPGLALRDFLASAVALGPPIAAAGAQSVGATILGAIVATRRRVATNTNLGIVLLLSPLAAAALSPVGVSGASLRDSVAGVLESLTVEDARLSYRAIRLAAPGGLGRVGDQDVAGEPSVDLRHAMALAADRDAVAREYITSYAITFDLVYPALRGYLDAGHDAAGATVGAYLRLLAAQPDSLILRRHGPRAATEVSHRAGGVLAAGGVDTRDGWAAISAFDRWLRAARPPLNPGTSADLVTAALFVALLEGVPVLAPGTLVAGISPEQATPQVPSDRETAP